MHSTRLALQSPGATFDCIPNELLIKIIVCAVYDPNHRPSCISIRTRAALLFVSRRLRMLVLACTKLFSFITAKDGPSFEHTKEALKFAVHLRVDPILVHFVLSDRQFSIIRGLRNFAIHLGPVYCLIITGYNLAMDLPPHRGFFRQLAVYHKFSSLKAIKLGKLTDFVPGVFLVSVMELSFLRILQLEMITELHFDADMAPLTMVQPKLKQVHLLHIFPNLQHLSINCMSPVVTRQLLCCIRCPALLELRIDPLQWKQNAASITLALGFSPFFTFCVEPPSGTLTVVEPVDRDWTYPKVSSGTYERAQWLKSVEDMVEDPMLKGRVVSYLR